jgi:hypothetical protein
VASRFGSLPVPAALTKGVSLAVIDYTEKEGLATAGADGTATVSYDQLQQGQYWRVERIVVVGNSANECTVFVYQGDDPISQRQRDGTPLPPGIVGVSEYPSYLTILPTSCLTVVVAGANQGDVFNVTAQYQVVQKITGQWA